MAKKKTEAHSGELGKGDAISIDEIGAKTGIEPVSANDFVKASEMEDFMNQYLVILVAEDTSPEANPVIVPSVNGINQPIIRGKKIRVRRKYVEALARSTYTRYEQSTPDPGKPDNIQMIEKKALLYPFSVYEDPHPNGHDWLQAILNEKG